jgi:tetratricopeptide (TPR) repeat protein
MPSSTEPSRNGGGVRLESWKEIAAYLKRDRRTVQRWEAKEGLPVHRHVHESQATVFAYAEELDAWLAGRLDSPDGEQDAPTSQPWGRLRLWPAAGVLVFLSVAVATTGSRSPRLSLPFHERDWILLEGFENRTGEALFDGTLRAALERELSNSEFVNVAPRERVEDALRLMRKPLDATLNVTQAREVCLRDGGIRALVTGRTEKVGSTYLVSAEVIDPVQNLTLAADTETASAQDQIWPAVRRLSNWVRETLGETMERIDRSNRQLEKVTTPSLRALQLFTEADSASRRKQWAVSAQLTRQALVEDPDFASARLWLAWALRNLSDPEWKTEAQRALDLSDRVSERERYFIVGSYELMMGHPARALPAFEALVRRYPDHYFAYLNLEDIYRRLGRLEEGADIAARLADARPNDPVANANTLTLMETRDLVRARRYAQRAELGSLEGASPLDRVNVMFFHAHDLWMHDDARGALAELQRLSAQGKDLSDSTTRLRFTFEMASFQLSLGKFQSTQQLRASIDDPQPSWIPTVYFFKGDEDHAREGAALIPPGYPPGQWGLPAFLVARLWPPGAEKKLPAERIPLIDGEVDLTQGRVSDAVALLQRAFDDTYRNHLPQVQWVADSLVTALERAGNSQKALEVLEATSGTRLWTTPAMTTYQAFWLRDQARLSAYYHRLGRQAEARKIDDQLRKLLAVADPDDPILRQLNGP